MNALTLIHVAISLAAILSGFVVLYGMLTAQRLAGGTKFFLVTTVTTSATGFLFPFRGITPAIVFGILSLVLLAGAIYALYVRNLAGKWRGAYVITALFAFYLNVFVLVVQSFQKIPPLKAIAPTQSELPFKLAQLVVLVAFIGAGIFALKRFRPAPASSRMGGEPIHQPIGTASDLN